jgi:predicted transcriptional regulator
MGLLGGTSPGDPHDHQATEGLNVATDLKKGARITGSARDKLAAELRKKYDAGQSIRALAESSGRSYGFVHRILTESGVVLRGRGGATRRKKD